MDKCKNCGASLSLGATDCAVCGALVRPEPRSPGTGKALDPKIGKLANIFYGNHGLSETYWIYGWFYNLVLGFAINLAFAATKSGFVAFFSFLLLWAFNIFITIAIWRAANKYPGNKSWSTLAKIGVVLGNLQIFWSTTKFYSVYF